MPKHNPFEHNAEPGLIEALRDKHRVELQRRLVAEVRHEKLLKAAKAGLAALVSTIKAEFETPHNPHPEDKEPAVRQLREAIRESEGGK